MTESIIDVFSTLFKWGVVAVIVWAPFHYMNRNSCSSCKWPDSSDCSDLLDDDEKSHAKKKNESRKLSKKERRRIEKAIDDAYKRMR